MFPVMPMSASIAAFGGVSDFSCVRRSILNVSFNEAG